jgi:hypothetical protein
MNLEKYSTSILKAPDCDRNEVKVDIINIITQQGSIVTEAENCIIARTMKRMID